MKCKRLNGLTQIAVPHNANLPRKVRAELESIMLDAAGGFTVQKSHGAWRDDAGHYGKPGATLYEAGSLYTIGGLGQKAAEAIAARMLAANEQSVYMTVDGVPLLYEADGQDCGDDPAPAPMAQPPYDTPAQAARDAAPPGFTVGAVLRRKLRTGVNPLTAAPIDQGLKAAREFLS